MPRAINRNEVQRLVAREGATLVEVLELDQYEAAHLPDAIHLEYRHWHADAVAARLPRERPVIVYCNNLE